MLPVENIIKWTSHRILRIRISLGSRFQLQQTILIFWNRFPIKRILPFKNRKSEHHHWILHIWVGLSTKSQLKLKIFIFWTKFAQKGYFQSKADAMNISIEFCIFKLVQVPNFTLNGQFWFFGTNFPTKWNSNQKQKSWMSLLNCA